MSLLKNGFGLGGKIERALSEKVQSEFGFGTDEYWMEQALLISMNSAGLSPPNPSVGCVLVKNKTVISDGFTQATGREHAERMAFQKLAKDTDLSDVTAYVTLEPCSHFGSQPPCADLFLGTNIKRLVVGCQDPDVRVNGAGLQKLRAYGIEIKIGVLEEEIKAFLFPFFFDRIQKRPAWIGKWARTPNGFLADASGNSKWISNEKSRAYTHWLRQKYDVILVGAETYLKDQPKLNVRTSAPPHQRDPIPVLFDPKGKLLHFDIPSHFQHWVGEAHLPKEKASRHDFVIPNWKTENELFLNFKKALNQYSFPKPLQSVMVEGGPTLLNKLLALDAFDAIHQFTGVQEFAQNDKRYQTHWNPSDFWDYTTSYYFDQDHLQEWRKRF
jgi:diaminohydroxyphosphoribosylaminopyrimidine deaminase/5-amino-6-(5-phosphoribosylamino)uracil reductase